MTIENTSPSTPALEKLKLTPEILEIIMGKVRDIDVPGNAFTFYGNPPYIEVPDGVLAWKPNIDTKTLGEVFKSGLLGHDKKSSKELPVNSSVVNPQPEKKKGAGSGRCEKVLKTCTYTLI